MKQLISDLRGLVITALGKVGKRILKEPAIAAGAVASAIVWVAGHFGVILDAPTLTAVLTPLIAGIVTRFFVTPASNVAVKKSDIRAVESSSDVIPPKV